jgi:GNAT superfamily N-acetyltransferase
MSKKYHITQLETRIDSPVVGCVYFTAYAGKGRTPVAVLRLEVDEPAAFIRTVFVAKKHRGTGLGTKLLKACFRRCRKAKKRTVGLWLNDANKKAGRLYRRLGFVRYLGGHDGYTQYIKVL